MANEPNKPPSLAHIDVPTVMGVLGGVNQELVDARTLHKELKVGRAFAHWIKERIEQFGLLEGRDFVEVSHGPNNGVVRQSFDYLMKPVVALRMVLAQRTFRGANSAPKDALVLQVAFFRERFLQQNPEYEKALRYLTIKGLSDDERANLMGWTLAQWIHAISEMQAAGVCAPSSSAVTV